MQSYKLYHSTDLTVQLSSNTHIQLALCRSSSDHVNASYIQYCAAQMGCSLALAMVSYECLDGDSCDYDHFADVVLLATTWHHKKSLSVCSPVHHETLGTYTHQQAFSASQYLYFF